MDRALFETSIVVVGEGPYSAALAVVLGATRILESSLRAQSLPSGDRANAFFPPTVQHVFYIVPPSTSVSGALEGHGRIWSRIESDARHGDAHSIAFVFILPAQTSPSYAAALTEGLCLSPERLLQAGHGICDQSWGLADILRLAESVETEDLIALRGRYAADRKRAAIRHLLETACIGNAVAVGEAARIVAGQFIESVSIDAFCREPSHTNGRLLREWVVACANGPVTPELCESGKVRLPNWLKDMPG
jgi:hypothetical protein